MLYEIVTVGKIVFYALLMLLILVIMTLALLSIINDDMEFGEGTISLKPGRIPRILVKLGLCGAVLAGYIVMMVLIR